ncbi:AAA family ATPase [Aristophania vespae]|uniref:AAA family ATPase n=1 Tax=Aristophania vespae TaxID=2697033 RepID=A0A6P1NH59_9PROT|nr:AAA family ATPase [Aristophania vespae]QHI96217.1 AAA family ATPase [Aristophania vespae]
MRFEKLSLTPYGSLKEKHFHFPQKERDLHIIFGPNEAGKSTTSAAIRDFLFGFPFRSKGDDWKSRTKFRVGGTISHKGQLLSGVRRSSRKASFYDETDQNELDDQLIKECLGSLDRENFEKFWSLDHYRLRDGGKSFTESKHDNGFQLLAASLGIENLASIQDAIHTKKEALWKKGGRVPELNQALSDYDQTNKTLKGAITLPKKLLETRKQLEDRKSQLDNIKNQITNIDIQLHHLTKKQNLLCPFNHYKSALKDCESYPAPVFTQKDGSAILDNCTQYETILIQAEKQSEKLTRLKSTLENLGKTPDFLADDQLIQDSFKLEEELAASQTDYETKAKRRIILQENIDSLYAQLSLSKEDKLPLEEDFDELESHCQKRRDISVQWESHSNSLTEDDLEKSTLEADLPPEPQREALRLLSAWRDHASSQVSLDGTLEQTLLDLDELKRSIEQQKKRLEFLGSDISLENLVPPSEEERLLAQKKEENAQNDLDQKIIKQSESQCELDLKKLELAQIENKLTISPKDVSNIREERNSLLNELSENHSNPEQFQEIFLSLKDKITKTDQLIDQYLTQIENLAKFKEIEAQRDKTALLHHQHSEAVAQSRKNLDKIRQDWFSRLKDAHLPALSPTEFVLWRQNYERYLDFHKKLGKANDTINAAKGKKEQLFSRLEKLMPLTGPYQCLRPFHSLTRKETRLSKTVKITMQCIMKSGN